MLAIRLRISWTRGAKEAVERLELFRSRISNSFSRSRERAQRLVAVYPLQTMAAIAGICFAAGAALRLGRRSHRGRSVFEGSGCT